MEFKNTPQIADPAEGIAKTPINTNLSIDYKFCSIEKEEKIKYWLEKLNKINNRDEMIKKEYDEKIIKNINLNNEKCKLIFIYINTLNLYRAIIIYRLISRLLGFDDKKIKDISKKLLNIDHKENINLVYKNLIYFSNKLKEKNKQKNKKVVYLNKIIDNKKIFDNYDYLINNREDLGGFKNHMLKYINRYYPEVEEINE